MIARKGGVAMVVGAVDMGKSTFCAAVAFHSLSFHKKVAVVDADIGQSDIGPPGTIGMGFAHPDMNRLADIPLISLYFVGDISPRGHFLDMVIGTQKMVQKALSMGAELVLVDTTGFVSGMAARKLKSFKIEAVRPNHLVVLQKRGELEHIVKGWERTDWLSIYRLPPSPLAIVRSFEERKTNRERKIISHFKNAFLLSLSFKEIAFRNSSIVSLEEEAISKLSIVVGEDLQNRYVGLVDSNGEYLNVGIIEKIDFAERVLYLLSPLKEKDKISTLVLGSLKIKLS